MEVLSEMAVCTVLGHTLVPVGRVAGRMTYTLKCQGEVWRITPDIQATYLVRRIRDGLHRECASLEAAVTYATADRP